MTHAKPVRIVFMVLISLAVVSLCGCKKHGSSEPEATRPATDTPALIVMQATRCARLYTTEYKIHKVVTHEDVRRLKGRILSIPVDMNLSVGSRKAAIPIDVTLKAYIDFAGFDAGHVQRDSNRIVIILPDPHIVATASRVDHKATRQYVDLTRSRFSDRELADFARQGADSIVAHAYRYGLEESARRSAVKTLLPVLRRMGYEERDITVKFRKNFSPDDWRTMITFNQPD